MITFEDFVKSKSIGGTRNCLSLLSLSCRVEIKGVILHHSYVDKKSPTNRADIHQPWASSQYLIFIRTEYWSLPRYVVTKCNVESNHSTCMRASVWRCDHIVNIFDWICLKIAIRSILWHLTNWRIRILINWYFLVWGLRKLRSLISQLREI